MKEIIQFILHINQQQGTTVLLTKHDIRDVERLCERVLIIDHGRLLYDGRLEKLGERFGGRRQLVVEFEQEYAELRKDYTTVSQRTQRV
jgi:ABC-2 type transport system ATP-binding protein